MNVNNRGVIARLTWRNLKAGSFRNIMAILAIALTAIMFTSITTMGGAMFQSLEENTFRQVGTSAHGGYKYLSEDEYEKVVAAGEYEDISYNIILGFATNPELQKKQHELRYTEEKQAKWGFSYPTEGTLPKDYKDIAVSTTTLDLLGLPYELGQTIKLDFMVGEEQYSDDFNLVGFWPGDEVMMATQCFLSKEYVRSLAPDPGEKADALNFVGTISADVWFENAVDVESKFDALTLSAGLDPEDMRVGVNWGYTVSGSLDYTTLFLVGSMVLIVMLSGYLIIYSIFAISVSGDIQFYGLLKTIGTTGRQIKRIVRGQALALSFVGIPIGLALGFVIGTKLAPIMMSITSYSAPSSVKANPWVFLLSAVFSLITVFISCRKPGKMAAKVSPIEALRYTETGSPGKKTAKKSRKVSPFSMAWANINRSRRRLITVLMSLSLSMILLNSVVSMVASFDMNTYLQKQVLSDFYFTGGTILNASASFESRDFESISNEFVQEASELPGTEEYGRILYNNNIHEFGSDAITERFEKIVRPYVEEGWGAEELDRAAQEGYTYLQVYGIDKLPFETLEDNYQNIDWEKFNSGNFALVTPFIKDGDGGKNDGDTSFYRIGEKIPLEGADGKITQCEVLGYIDYPHAMGSQFSQLIGTNLVLSSDTFEAVFGEQQAFSLMLNTDDDYIDKTEEWAEDLTSGRLKELTYRSRAYYIDEFKGLQNSFMMLGGALSFVLALIGIMNFINTMATSIMTRKRELAMLQSVGMTGKQLRQMLFFEGLWYAILTLALTMTVGVGISAGLVKGIVGGFWFFKFHFSLTPMLICTPVLLALCALIPLVCSRILQRESVVERLREN